MIVETGAYIRVQRDGRWQSIAVERLTPAELKAEFASKHPVDLLNWMVMLCQTLRQAEDTLERMAMESFAENG